MNRRNDCPVVGCEQRGESVEQMPDSIEPIRIARKAKEAVAQRRLELVYSNPHRRNSIRKRVGCDRLDQIDNFAAIFANEVAKPLGGLFASLLFALKDLQRFRLHDSIRKTSRDISIIRDTLQGALREVDDLLELLDDFPARLITKASPEGTCAEKSSGDPLSATPDPGLPKSPNDYTAKAPNSL